MKKVSNKLLAFCQVFIMLFLIFFQNFPVFAATSDYQTILKKIGIVTTYAQGYPSVGKPIILTASYLASTNYNEGYQNPWFYLTSENLNKEISIDANGLEELQNIPDVTLSNGDIIDFNLLAAVFLQKDISGGYSYLINEAIKTNKNITEEEEQYNASKDYFEQNKNKFLAVIDGENLLNLYSSNNSVYFEDLVKKYYETTNSQERFIKFVSNLFGDDFEFSKENLKQNLYTQLINNKFYTEGLENQKVIDKNSFSTYEPLIKNTIYAFSDVLYDNYPSLNIEKLEFAIESNALEVNHDYNIPISYSPQNIKDKNILFNSSDEEIATVNENGTVHTNKVGSFTLTATSGEVSTSKEFNVYEEGISVDLNKKTLSLNVKQGEQLTATIEPSSSSQTIHWESSDNLIATVNESGYVEAIKPGEVRIIASTETGAFAECLVTIAQPVYNIKIEEAPDFMEKGTTDQIKVSITPEDAENKDVVYFSNNEKVLRIDNNGIITAVEKGQAKITAQSVDDASIFDEHLITVSSLIKDIQLEDSMEILLGSTLPLNVTLIPEDAPIDDLEYQSNNDICSVDSKGNITARLLGTSEITVSSKNNPTIKNNIQVNVVQPVTQIALNTNNIKLKEGESFSLSITVLPRDAKNPDYDIEVEDSTICSLNGMNHVSGLKAGTTRIIISSKDGSNIQEICTVTVEGNSPIVLIIIIVVLAIVLIGFIIFLVNRRKINAYIKGF